MEETMRLIVGYFAFIALAMAGLYSFADARAEAEQPADAQIDASSGDFQPEQVIDRQFPQAAPDFFVV